jgi:hypothetical protein
MPMKNPSHPGDFVRYTAIRAMTVSPDLGENQTRVPQPAEWTTRKLIGSVNTTAFVTGNHLTGSRLG